MRARARATESQPARKPPECGKYDVYIGGLGPQHGIRTKSELLHSADMLHLDGVGGNTYSAHGCGIDGGNLPRTKAMDIAFHMKRHK